MSFPVYELYLNLSKTVEMIINTKVKLKANYTTKTKKIHYARHGDARL